MPRFKDVFKLFVFAVLILLGTLTLFSCDINKSDSNDITVGIKISDDTVFRFGKDVNVIIPSTKDDVKITKIDVRDGVDFNNGDYPAKTIIIPKTIKVITQRSFSFLSNLEAFYVDPNSQYFKSIDGVLYDKSGTLLLCYPRGKTEETFAIPEGVKVILEGAFKGNTHLKEVIIPDTVTTISEYAFSGLTRLKEINIPNSVINIEKGAFNDCIAATNINIGENVVSIGDEAFVHCKSVKSVILPNSLKKMGTGLFKQCYDLKEIVLPEGIVEIPAAMFAQCLNIEYFVVPDTVKKINTSAFAATSLKEIVLPEGLTWLGSDVFHNCKSLAEINLPASLEFIGGGTFANCVLLTDVTIPASVRTIGSAFTGCINLEIITFLGGDISFVGSGFENCPKLQRVNVSSKSDWVSMSFSSTVSTPFVNGAKLYINDEFITHFEFPEGTKVINNCLFLDYQWLESLIIPEGVEEIGFNAFANCENLTELTLPSSLSNIKSSAFGGCSKLKTVYLPSIEWLIESHQHYSCFLENVEDLYFNGVKTTEIIIPEGTETIASFAFYKCTAITSVYIPKSLRYLSTDSFSYCGDLEIYYEGTMKEWRMLDENSHYWYNEYTDYYIIHCSDGDLTT